VNVFVSVVCFLPLIVAALAAWIAAIVLYRKGRKNPGIVLGVAGGILSLIVLCLGVLVILPHVPGVVDPGWFPTPVFDAIPTV